MSIPFRGRTGDSTYFITASTWQKRSLFQTDPMAALLLDVLLHYRAAGKYRLHEFVIMPTHFHLLLTSAGEATLERAVQFIKGGFSHRAGKELQFKGSVWQTSFYDRRVRDPEEYQRMRDYILQNPVRRGLVQAAEQWPYSSARPRLELDEVPRRLKPDASVARMQA